VNQQEEDIEASRSIEDRREVQPWVETLRRQAGRAVLECGCKCGCTLLNIANVSNIWTLFSVRARLL
jgi:protein-L-isoaspartate O-methyltransferase